MKKSVKKSSDIVILGGIFALVIICLISLFFAFNNSEYSGENEYTTFWYPLFNTLSQSVFAVILTLKAYRLSACVFTKIATHLWSALCLCNIVYILFLNSYYMLLLFATLLFSISTIITILLFIIKACLKK